MKNTVRNIFAQPEFVEGFGEIYPIKMKYYDSFMDSANILCLSYEHFNVEEIKAQLSLEEIALFELVILAVHQSTVEEEHFNNLSSVFSYVTGKEVYFDYEKAAFFTHDGMTINKDNYEKIRNVIMKQNLLFIPKVYKNKKIREWADKVLKARAKSGVDSTIEDMISTIAVISCKDYDTLAEYSIYQIRQEFNRILKIEAYRTAIAHRAAGFENVEVNHYAEFMDMFKDPYTDIFKEKSKLKNFNLATQGG